MGEHATDGVEASGEVHPATTAQSDLSALTEAFEVFTRTTASMEESYRRLEERVQLLDAELQEKNRQLELTTEYLNAVLESMSDGVIAANSHGEITIFNRAAATILDRETEDVVGSLASDVLGHPVGMKQRPRVRELKRRDGAKVPVSEKASPISGRDGGKLGTVHVFQDLSELESLREEVRRRDRLSALGEMAATVAHEIRNPLGGIRGFAALLERDIDADDPRARLVQKILSGTQSLDRVVNELLEYTRPVELRIERIDCAELVGAALAYIEDVPDGVEIENRLRTGPALDADSLKCRQALLNILLNALQSLDGKGVLTITATSVGGFVEIAVSDTGCGIGEEELPKVFMPFFTTREKGTGLGLAVAAKNIESHGGSITVESVPGAGSTFRVRLPAAEDA